MTAPSEPQLREIFREYIQAKRELLEVTVRCYLKGWPDRKAAVEDLAKMSGLVMEEELLRFDYLLGRARVETAEWTSLKNLVRRLSNQWEDSDEVELKATNPAYRELLTRLAAATPIDKSALDGPGKGARADREWQNAIHAFDEKHDELDSRLTRLHLR